MSGWWDEGPNGAAGSQPWAGQWQAQSSMAPAGPSGPPAGWFPDPEVPGGQRYWDGGMWTEHRVAPSPVVRAVPAPLPSPAYGHQYAGYPQYGQPVVSPKTPALSLIVSFFIPGVGSMINGDVGLGVGILIGFCISWLFSLILIGLPFLFGFWVWGMVDAYQGAVRWNARHGIVS
ncbi:MAG: DUF2510 domain-containing protein [Microthrixaceae bacterium]